MTGGTATPTKKIPAIVVGAALTGLVGWLLEAAGTHPQVYSSVATAVGGLILLVPEYRERRNKTPTQKVQELVRGDVHEHPVVVVAYLVLALQLFQRLLGALVGLAITIGLRDASVAENEVADVVAVASPIIVFVLVLPMTVYFAQLATYRLASNAMLWIGVAIAISAAINAVVLGLAQEYVGQDLSWATLVVGGFVEFVLLGVAAYVGYRRAARRRPVYVMSRLVPQLSPSEQHDLIELVKTLPRAADEGASEDVTTAGPQRAPA